MGIVSEDENVLVVGCLWLENLGSCETLPKQSFYFSSQKQIGMC
jgi:hypothetical protein